MMFSPSGGPFLLSVGSVLADTTELVNTLLKELEQSAKLLCLNLKCYERKSDEKSQQVYDFRVWPREAGKANCW